MSTELSITAELLARYDRPGPRYTSYPTAPQFHAGFDAAAYAGRLAAASRRPDEPLALYVHIPFCEKRCLYCGCHVVVTRREDVVDDYVAHLEREIALVAAALGDRRDVLQLHWGGGTPTHLSPERMRRLHATLAGAFRLRPGAEAAVEIDPRVTTPAHLATLRELGFNRLSLGVQDFTPAVQEAIGRRQRFEDTRAVMDEARRLGFAGFNVDLVYGLPRQTEETFRRSLDRVLELQPGRVAVYSYAHVPWIRPHQRRIDESELPDAKGKFALLAAAISVFTAAGYVRIGMDHFARPEDELSRAQSAGTLTRNFMGYTVQAAPDLVAFGVSGIGDVAGAFAQNAKSLASYYRALDGGRLPVERGYELDADDRVRGFVIRSIMCNFELDFAELQRRHDVEFAAYFADEADELRSSIESEFYRLEPDRLRLTPLGSLFVRNVCMVFDRYLGRPGAERPLYSRTV